MLSRSPHKAQLAAEIAVSPDESTSEEIRAAFASREKAIEHDIDHTPLDMAMEISISYNFLSK
jgi:hypothetical protein